MIHWTHVILKRIDSRYNFFEHGINTTRRFGYELRSSNLVTNVKTRVIGCPDIKIPWCVTKASRRLQAIGITVKVIRNSNVWYM